MYVTLTCVVLLCTRETTKTCAMCGVDPQCSGRSRAQIELMFGANTVKIQSKYNQNTVRIQSEYSQQKKHSIAITVSQRAPTHLPFTMLNHQTNTTNSCTLIDNFVDNFGRCCNFLFPVFYRRVVDVFFSCLLVLRNLFRVVSSCVVKFCFLPCLLVSRNIFSCRVFLCREMFLCVVSLCVAKFCFVSCLCVSRNIVSCRVFVCREILLRVVSLVG